MKKINTQGNPHNTTIAARLDASSTNLCEGESACEDHERSPSPHHRQKRAVLVDILRRPGRDAQTHDQRKCHIRSEKMSRRHNGDVGTKRNVRAYFNVGTTVKSEKMGSENNM